jgi:surface polysaccharide O-acyltransferase-like enzyme
LVDWKTSLSQRWLKLLPLYLLWSAIHLISFTLYPEWRIMPEYSLTATAVGGLADYQLYFVPLILQLYLVFPWLIKLTKKGLMTRPQ